MAVTSNLSPAVNTYEVDQTSYVTGDSSSVGAAVAPFSWGAIESPTSINGESDLVARFGKPEDENAQDWLAISSFLSYSSNLVVVRTDADGLYNAVSSPSGGIASIDVADAGSGYTSVPVITISAPDISGGTQAEATAILSGGGITSIAVENGGTGYSEVNVTISAPDISGGTQAEATATIDGGAITGFTITESGSGYTSAPIVTITGDGTEAIVGTVSISSSSVLSITLTEAGSGYTSAPTVTIDAPYAGEQATVTVELESLTGVKIKNLEHYTDSFELGEGNVGQFAAKYAGSLGNSILVSMADSATFADWEYKSYFGAAPSTTTYVERLGGSNDELYLVIIDKTGLLTGTAGTVLESYDNLSKAKGTKGSDGTNIFYKDVINNYSSYIYWMDYPVEVNNWGTSYKEGIVYDSLSTAFTAQLSGGADDYESTDGQRQIAWSKLTDTGAYTIDLLFAGTGNATTFQYMIESVAEARTDCVALGSPLNPNTGGIIRGTGSDVTSLITAYRALLPSSSYGMLDSGYKYMYDKYSDVYRYVPLNGDVAGLCAKTDSQSGPWTSPAGLNRGSIKNCIKLAIPLTDVSDRDALYPQGINPVIKDSSAGFYLFGDKTLQTKSSVFDRINVRRTFILIERNVGRRAKYVLFENNNETTRASFSTSVEAYLENLKGKGAIVDYEVVCDSTNNTPDVIQSNRFKAYVRIKPSISINWVDLTFFAVNDSVQFTVSNS